MSTSLPIDYIISRTIDKLMTPDVEKTIHAICQALHDKKAEDIRVFDVAEKSSITDYMIIANGNSEPHLRALRKSLEDALHKQKQDVLGIDYEADSGWLVVDGFTFMVHLFRPDMREDYALEALWKDSKELKISVE